MPLPCNGAGVSYTCTSIARSLDRSALGVSIFTPYGHVGVKAEHSLDRDDAVGAATPAVLARQEVGDPTERAFLSAGGGKGRVGRQGHRLCLAGSLASLVRQIKDLGVPIVRELVNCTQATGKKILDMEYLRMGLRPRRYNDRAFG